MLSKLNEILGLFTAERPELTPLEVSELSGRPRSTTYRLLSRFADAGFLDFDALTGRYRLGIRLAGLGELARRSTTLQRVARPTLQELSRETQETAALMVRSGGQGLTIEVVGSAQPLTEPDLLGRRLPLHASAGGKVLLAWLSPEERREVLRPPLKRYTAATITDVAALERELDRVRDHGYSTVRGEWSDEVSGAAAPVWNHAGQLCGAMIVGGPRPRIDAERLAALAAAVVRAATQASRAGGFTVASEAEPGAA